MLNFYDFEVFEFDWLVVIINPIDKTQTTIINDKEKLEQYYEAHKHEIWLGYNSRRYDQFIFKAILCDFNPADVNRHIIMENKPGWSFSDLFRKIPLINFDLMLKNDGGLKTLEAFMGNSIEETSVPFDIDRKLTKREITETVMYCTHDVEQSIEVFLNRKEEFDAMMGLIKIFKRPLSDMSKTKAQLVAAICGGTFKEFDDEFDFEITSKLQLFKYKYIERWYRNPINHDYKKSQIEMIAGIPHTFAWGGIHGATGKIKTGSNGKRTIESEPYYGEGLYIMADVTAYYPSMQLEYKWGYRNMGAPENFEHIHNENLRLKKIDKKARLPYKIADNSISGQLKDKFSAIRDPRDNNAICVNGQLLLLDLIEKLEPHIEMLVQSNTDGILFKIEDTDEAFEKVDDIVWEWEQRTGMRMGFDVFNKVFQKDVNNYLLVAPDGSYKSKGAYVKSLSPLDYDLPIVNKAMIDYMTKGVPVETTIGQCGDLIMFQKVVKLTGKYKHVLHNGKYHVNKCYRVFSSKRPNDGTIYKCKTGKNPEKFANTPPKCFINNADIKQSKVPPYLDRSWYVEIAKERLRQFGVE